MDLSSGNSTVVELAVVPEASAAAEAAVAVAAGAIVVVADASTNAVVAVVNTVAEPTAVVEDTAAVGTAPSSSAAGKDTAAARAVLPHGTPLLMGAGQHPSDLEPLKPLDQQKQLWGPVGPYLYGLADELRNSLVLVVECSFCSVSG